MPIVVDEVVISVEVTGGPAPAGAPAGGGGRGGGEEGGGGGLNIQGLPLIKPPYGRITAIDLNQGELVWQVAHGETADNVKKSPALKGVTIPRTGRNGRVGVLTTKALTIAGDSGVFCRTLPSQKYSSPIFTDLKSIGIAADASACSAPSTASRASVKGSRLQAGTPPSLR